MSTHKNYSAHMRQVLIPCFLLSSVTGKVGFASVVGVVPSAASSPQPQKLKHRRKAKIKADMRFISFPPKN